MELTPDDRELLAFEGSWWNEPGSKVDRIRTQLSIPPSRYYKRLHELIDTAEAMAFDPLLVRRLRRRRGHDEPLGPSASGRNDR